MAGKLHFSGYGRTRKECDLLDCKSMIIEALFCSRPNALENHQ